MGCCSKPALSIVNAVELCMGIAIVVTASYFISISGDFSFLLKDETLSLPAYALVFTLIILLLGFQGWFGALVENSCMLKVYGIILALLLIGEHVIGILMLLNAKIPEEVIMEDMDNTYANYENGTGVAENIDHLQHILFCCGVRNYTDWIDYPYGQDHNSSVPDSCCKPEYYGDGCGLGVLLDPSVEDMIYNKGCYYLVYDTLVFVEIVIGILCITLALIQVVSLGCYCALRKNRPAKTVAFRPELSPPLKKMSEDV